MPLPLLPLLLVLLALPFVRSQAEPYVGQDADGNLHLRSMFGKGIFVEGVDVLAELSALTSVKNQLESEMRALTTEMSFLKTLAATPTTTSPATPIPMLYAVGGFVNGVVTSEFLSSVERFNGTAWAPAPSMRVPREGAGVAAFDGYIYAAGGRADLKDTFLDSVERFDGVTWNMTARMSTARWSPGAAVFSGHLYIVGGFNLAVGGLQTAERFNGTHWMNVESMNQARVGPALVVFGDSLTVIGGMTGRNTGVLASMETLVAGSWSPATGGMREVRALHGATVYNGSVVITGGLSAVTVYYQTTEFLNATTSVFGQPLAGFRCGHGQIVYNNTIYVVGGWNGTALSSTVVWTGRDWVQSVPMLRPRSRVGLAVF